MSSTSAAATRSHSEFTFVVMPSVVALVRTDKSTMGGVASLFSQRGYRGSSRLRQARHAKRPRDDASLLGQDFESGVSAFRPCYAVRANVNILFRRATGSLRVPPRPG